MSRPIHFDRAAIVAVAIRQIIADAIDSDEWQDRLEEYLRIELSDIARQAAADIPQSWQDVRHA
jgi:hypothetical protein